MSFITDKQTLEDLNLLGKYKNYSIFSLFNIVKTSGGEKLLHQMFQAPLTNPKAINKRSSIFKYFQDKQTAFPFNNEQFSQAEEYLGHTTGNNYPAILISLATKKMAGITLRDEQYKKILNGLQQTLTVLDKCKNFISQFKETGHPFYNELLAAKNILTDKRLDLLTEIDSFRKWPLSKVVKYEYRLKHIMGPDLQKLFEFFYQLDVYIAVANLAKEKGFNYATAISNETNRLTAKTLWHPNIDKAVANPVSFDQHSNMIFLTGANMAGKSTFMKAFGINVYLAHMGFPVGASHMEFSVKDGIYSSINVPDNLGMGYSHFYAEVLRVKKVAEEVSSGKDLVILFDELFKGTNVKDAYDATLAVTAAFSEYGNCLFIISTHIIEAGEQLKHNSNIQPLYLPTIMNGNVPIYTYQLQQGISSDRHGMMIIENEGILKILHD